MRNEKGIKSWYRSEAARAENYGGMWGVPLFSFNEWTFFFFFYGNPPNFLRNYYSANNALSIYFGSTFVFFYPLSLSFIPFPLYFTSPLRSSYSSKVQKRRFLFWHLTLLFLFSRSTCNQSHLLSILNIFISYNYILLLNMGLQAKMLI